MIDLKFGPIKYQPPEPTGDTPKDILLRSLPSRDCGTIGLALLKIYQEYNLNFADMEKLLREYKAPIYLLAAPTGRNSPETLPRNPISKDLTPYWLWICVHGQEEALRFMKDFNIPSPEVNLERLKETGFLFARPKGTPQ